MKWQNAVLRTGVCNKFGVETLEAGEEANFSAAQLQALIDAAVAEERELCAIKAATHQTPRWSAKMAGHDDLIGRAQATASRADLCPNSDMSELLSELADALRTALAEVDRLRQQANDDMVKVGTALMDLQDMRAENERLRVLVRQVISAHADPESPWYNDCHSGAECVWCFEAMKAVGVPNNSAQARREASPGAQG